MEEENMFQVFVDSAANIPATIVKEYGIHVISFVNMVNGEPLVCFNPDLTEEQEREEGRKYYDAIRQGAEVKTSLISTGTFEDEFRPVLEAGEDIIYFSLSHGISGNYNAARIAVEELAEEFPERKIRLVDSLNASLAQGILGIYAVEMREKGEDIDTIADRLQEYAHKMNGLFTVEDLKYLSRTGRLSNAKAFVGNILGIKPILKGSKEGVIVAFQKVRTRKRSLATIIDLVVKNIENPEDQIIGIAHADCYEESLYVMEQIQEKVKVRRFINTSYDYCTGSHVGPGTIALFFMAKDRELDQ
jgi:DegV family protein with EDD domain